MADDPDLTPAAGIGPIAPRPAPRAGKIPTRGVIPEVTWADSDGADGALPGDPTLEGEDLSARGVRPASVPSGDSSPTNPGDTGGVGVGERPGGPVGGSGSGGHSGSGGSGSGGHSGGSGGSRPGGGSDDLVSGSASRPAPVSGDGPGEATRPAPADGGTDRSTSMATAAPSATPAVPPSSDAPTTPSATPPTTPAEPVPAPAASTATPTVTRPAPRPMTPPVRPTSASAPPSPADVARPKADWAAEVADRIDDVVAKVRANTSDRLVGIARMVVYGLLAAVMAVMAAVLLVIFAIRLLDVIIPGDVWIPYVLLGAIFLGAGLLLWSKRAAPAAKA